MSKMNQIKTIISSGEDEKYDEYAIKSAMQTLLEAEKVKQDTKLMGLVQAELRKQRKAIESIQDLKDRYVEITMRAPEKDLYEEDGTMKIKPDKKVGGKQDDDEEDMDD